MRSRFLLIALLLFSLSAMAQHLPVGTVYGKVTDETGHPIEMANVVALDVLSGQTTDARGAQRPSVGKKEASLFYVSAFVIVGGHLF